MDADRLVTSIQSATTREASSALFEWLKGWEALRLRPYRDAGGRWTVGYGCLMEDDDNPAQCITVDEAEALLTTHVMATALNVSELITNALTLNALSQAQFDALVAFSYNVGYGGFARSTVRLKINAGQIDEAADYFALWNQVRSQRDGKLYESKGLTKRRAAETAMYRFGDYSLRP